MSWLAEEIHREIEQHGPISFDRFMELALYHPEWGYYRRRDRSPIGRSGDFFTASQMQPVFGRAIARAIEDLRQEMACPDSFTVVELGPGRGEMAEALRKFRYVGVEVGDDLPPAITGVVFSNEFFDALPVQVIKKVSDGWRERRVGFSEGRFEFADGELISDSYLSRYTSDQEVTEIPSRSLEWMTRIARSLHCGYVLTIDYGYTTRETIRFPEGSLMSYRDHLASPDVLDHPGERDITSHVPFDALQDAGIAEGLQTLSLETLSQFLIRLGERDGFREFVEGGGELKLKTLLYGMGETFRVLTQKKVDAK